MKTALEDKFAEILVLRQFADMLRNIGRIDSKCLAALIRRGKANLIEQPLHHRMQPPGANVFNTGIDLSGELRDFRNPVFCEIKRCLLYTSPSPRDRTRSRMPSSA